MSGWQPVASFFDQEVDGPCVLLRVGGKEVWGYFDPDEMAWYRQGEGPDLESERIEPEGWNPRASEMTQRFVENLNRQTRDK